jgi:hypothetical protein
VQGNSVVGNMGPGVSVSAHAQTVLEENNIHANQQSGVMVWLYMLNAVDAWLETAWFQRFILKSDILVSNFAFKFNLYRYMMVWGHARPTFLRNRIHDNAAAGVVMGEESACTFSRNSAGGVHAVDPVDP